MKLGRLARLRVALARPLVQEGAPSVPAAVRGKPADTKDAEQEVAANQSMIHAGTAGGAAGPGVGGEPGPGAPGRRSAISPVSAHNDRQNPSCVTNSAVVPACLRKRMPACSNIYTYPTRATPSTPPPFCTRLTY